MEQLRRKLYIQLHTAAWPSKGLSPINKIIAVIILFSILTVVLETEPLLYVEFTDLFEAINMIIVTVFLVEYILRLWVMGENPNYNGVIGRLKYSVTPTAIIDLVSILPFLLGIGGSDAFLLRALRLLRIFSLAKLGRFSEATQILATAITNRGYELLISLGLALSVLLVSASVMYLVEGTSQPDAFGSIPRALWWSIATLTTVGYGDVYPVTVVGQVFAGITALAAIGLIAMPTGILAAAFSEAIQQTRRQEVDSDE